MREGRPEEKVPVVPYAKMIGVSLDASTPLLVLPLPVLMAECAACSGRIRQDPAAETTRMLASLT